MSAIAKRSIFLFGMLTLIVVVTLWAWAGTAQGAALDVTKTVDTDDGVCDADCSLREAIAVVNSGDTINVPIGTYTLTLGTDLVISTSLTLSGAGSGDTIIQAATSSADATSRVFDITGGTVSISGVTIQNGNTSGQGGGILNSGSLSLTASTVSGSSGTFGGGIRNSGTMTLTASTVSGNATEFGGGGIINIGTLTLTDSTVVGNTATGDAGGIRNDGTLTLTNSTISGNTGNGNGGGILNNLATVTVTSGSTVSGNTAGLNGGGIHNNGGILNVSNSTVTCNMASVTGGGGIYIKDDGTLTLTDSTVSGNTANISNGGGIMIESAGTGTLLNSTVSGNTAEQNGGGISNTGTLNLTNSTVSGNTANFIGGGGIYNAGTLTMTNGSVTGNSAAFVGGGIYNPSGTLTLTNSTVSGNTASGSGGGIFQSGGTVELTDSTVSGNTGSNGGGIFTTSTLTLTASTVSGNTASTGSGGGIFKSGSSSTLTLTNSTVSGNTAAGIKGGGIYAVGGIVTLTNSTVSGNTANTSGGGISNFVTLTLTNSTVSGNTAGDDGGGIYNSGGTLTLTNSTITENTAQAGGGGIGHVSGTTELVNTIIAVNSAAISGPDCFGSLTSLGYNLIRDDSSCGFTAATGDQVGDAANPIDPVLGPLQDNGGDTETHALLSGSPAIDAIPVADCSDIDGLPVATDQQGVVRPQGPACDMGAYEFETGPPPIVTATLTVFKEVVNDDGGTATADQWNIHVQDGGVDVDGSPQTGDAAGTDYVLDSGTYTVSETGGASGYSGPTFTGDCDDTGTVVLESGDNATCTLINDDQPAFVIVTKNVINDDGGSALSDDFNLTLDGGAVLSSIENQVNPGVHTADETQLAGYTFVGFSGDCDVNGNVTVALGETLECVLTNDDQPAIVIVTKNVINDNGGSALSDDFNLTLDGGAVLSSVENQVNPGVHTADETQLAGYTFVGFSGDCDVNGNVTVALGETLECVLTNDDQPAVVIVTKNVINDDGGSALPDDFNLTLDGGAVLSSVENQVNPGVHTADETQLAGYTFVGFSGDCDVNGNVTVALGETLECVLTNDDQPAIVIVTKNVINDDGGSALPDDFNLTLDGGAVLSSVENQVNPGVHTADETQLAGYTFVGFSGDCDVNGNVTVALGETLECVLTNDDQPANEPGGDPNTLGYWKNWNGCTSGSQSQTAAQNGGAEEGFFLVEDHLPQTIGNLIIDNCEDAVAILDKRTLSEEGKKSANDAAYEVAAQLLAAKLNLAAGAETCQAVLDATAEADALLDSIDFDGTGSYLSAKSKDLLRNEALTLAATLDEYNNGILC